MKTSELIGRPLDVAVEIALQGGQLRPDYNPRYAPEHSTDWAQGGPIIERENIWLTHHVAAKMHGAHKGDEHWFQRGPTTLVAAMRCYVASKLGDEVNIPEELL